MGSLLEMQPFLVIWWHRIFHTEVALSPYFGLLSGAFEADEFERVE